jgi:magnesium and cobalt transporter
VDNESGRQPVALRQFGVSRLALAGLEFTVLHTKGGAVRWFKVVRDPAADSLLRS